MMGEAKNHNIEERKAGKRKSKRGTQAGIEQEKKLRRTCTRMTGENRMNTRKSEPNNGSRTESRGDRQSRINPATNDGERGGGSKSGRGVNDGRAWAERWDSYVERGRGSFSIGEQDPTNRC